MGAAVPDTWLEIWTAEGESPGPGQFPTRAHSGVGPHAKGTRATSWGNRANLSLILSTAFSVRAESLARMTS